MSVSISRRKLCTGFAGLAVSTAALFAGCSSSSSTTGTEDGREGFSTDTLVKDYPVSLRFFADQDLMYYIATNGQTRFDFYAAKYAEQEGREQVTCSVEYLPSSELAHMVEQGITEGDGILAVTDIIEAAQEAEAIDAGAGGTSIRKLAYVYPANVHLVRTAGSAADLPAAATIDGNDAADGSVTRLMYLGQTTGGIALTNPDCEPVGVSALQILESAGLYLNDEFDDSIASRVRIYDTQNEAMAAVSSGECTFGFAFTASLSTRYPGVEDFYTPYGPSNISYQGAALACSAEAGVAKDFLQFMTLVSG